MPGDPASLLLLAALVLAVAVLYSSVGHAGASGYLAAMTLFGVAPAAMKPAALAMNIVVAVAGTARWASARLIPWPVLWPRCVTSVPAAFIGGYLALSANVYRPLLGVLLLVAAVRLWLPTVERELHGAPRPVSLAGLGAVLVFLAGLTGIGGGVFLSPVLILSGWEEPRRTAGASSAFILVNSVAGLLGACLLDAADPASNGPPRARGTHRRFAGVVARGVPASSARASSPARGCSHRGWRQANTRGVSGSADESANAK